MTASAGTRAYWQALGTAAERNGTDHTHPLKAPTVDITLQAAVATAKVLALLIGCRETGVLPNIDTEPSPESQLAAAELIERSLTPQRQEEESETGMQLFYAAIGRRHRGVPGRGPRPVGLCAGRRRAGEDGREH